MDLSPNPLIAGLLIVSAQLSCASPRNVPQKLELRIDGLNLRHNREVTLLTHTPYWDESQPPPPSFDATSHTALLDPTDIDVIWSRLSTVDFEALNHLRERDLSDLPDDARPEQPILLTVNDKTLAEWSSDTRQLSSVFREPFDSLVDQLRSMHFQRYTNTVIPSHVFLRLRIRAGHHVEQCQLVKDSSGSALYYDAGKSSMSSDDSSGLTNAEFEQLYRTEISPVVFDVSSDRLVPESTAQPGDSTFTFALTVNHQTVCEFTSPAGFTDQPVFETLWNTLNDRTKGNRTAQMKGRP